jgi:hypothetical protein
MCSFCPKAPQSYLENDHAATCALSREFKCNRVSAEASLCYYTPLFPFAILAQKQAEEAMVQGTLCFSRSCKMLRRPNVPVFSWYRLIDAELGFGS